MGEGETALEMYQKGFEYDVMQNSKEGQAISLCNIGETYTFLEQYDLAEETLLNALVIAEELNDSWTLTVPLMSLGYLYQTTGEFHKANQTQLYGASVVATIQIKLMFVI